MVGRVFIGGLHTNKLPKANRKKDLFPYVTVNSGQKLPLVGRDNDEDGMMRDRSTTVEGDTWHRENLDREPGPGSKAGQLRQPISPISNTTAIRHLPV